MSTTTSVAGAAVRSTACTRFMLSTGDDLLRPVWASEPPLAEGAMYTLKVVAARAGTARATTPTAATTLAAAMETRTILRVRMSMESPGEFNWRVATGPDSVLPPGSAAGRSDGVGLRCSSSEDVVEQMQPARTACPGPPSAAGR